MAIPATCYNRHKHLEKAQSKKEKCAYDKENVLLIYPEFAHHFGVSNSPCNILGKIFHAVIRLTDTRQHVFNRLQSAIVDMNVQPLTDADLHWADLVCTSTMIVQRKSLENVIARVKRAGKPVVAGGPHPTSYWEDIADVDYFLLGEVEATFPLFLRDLEHGTAKHIYVPREKPAITQTPLPRYDLINMRQYGSMLLQFSRGCPFDCEFCDITKLYGRVPRTKTNEQMLAEFSLLYDLGWRGSVFLVDDNFIGNRRDALRLLRASSPGSVNAISLHLCTEASMNLVEYEELMDAMMHAGFTSSFVGIETPTPAALIATKRNRTCAKKTLTILSMPYKHSRERLRGHGGLSSSDGDTPDALIHIRFINKPPSRWP